MTDIKSILTEENIKNLEMARAVYQGRMRDWINRRAEELLKFMRMQSSLIVQPNQKELQEQHQKLQKHDFELKRLSDLVWAATVLITYHVKPEILENMKAVRDQIEPAYKTIVDTKKDLKETKIEEVFAVSIIRDIGQFIPSLYPTTNPIEEVGSQLRLKDSFILS